MRKSIEELTERLAEQNDKIETHLAYLLNEPQIRKMCIRDRVVATMCQNEEAIDADLIAKKDFIHLLLPFQMCIRDRRGCVLLRQDIFLKHTCKKSNRVYGNVRY